MNTNEIKEALPVVSVEQYAILTMQITTAYTALLGHYPIHMHNDNLARILMRQAVTSVLELNALLLEQIEVAESKPPLKRYSAEEIEKCKNAVALKVVKFLNKNQ